MRSAKNKEKEAVVVWPCLQAQQHLQGVVAKNSTILREENMRCGGNMDVKMDELSHQAGQN